MLSATPKDREMALAADTPSTGYGQQLNAEPLETFLQRQRRFAVAFSGGTDSALLLGLAKLANCEVAAYMVKTAFQPSFELEDAKAVAKVLDTPLTVIEANILSEADICENPPDRCYLCKRFIFRKIAQAAARDGYTVIADGTNGSDNPALRPGFKALAEEGIISPLRRAGLSKAQVRQLSAQAEQQLGLPQGALQSNKPSFPCLAVFVPEGRPINAAALEIASCSNGITGGSR